MLEPLYTADEMRAAEAGHDVDAMMERAGRAVAEAVLERYPSARRIACVCGGGVDASTGEVAGAAVRAELTVTMHAPKVGLVVAPGRFHAGEVVAAEIGIEHGETRHRLVTEEILAHVPRRREGDNKYTAGAVLVVGGAPGLTGAVCLAAEAAFRADAGYVAVAVPEASLPVLELRLLEAGERAPGGVGAGAARLRAAP